jgi:hypothetical protein
MVLSLGLSSSACARDFNFTLKADCSVPAKEKKRESGKKKEKKSLIGAAAKEDTLRQYQEEAMTSNLEDPCKEAAGNPAAAVADRPRNNIGGAAAVVECTTRCRPVESASTTVSDGEHSCLESPVESGSTTIGSLPGGDNLLGCLLDLDVVVNDARPIPALPAPVGSARPVVATGAPAHLPNPARADLIDFFDVLGLEAAVPTAASSEEAEPAATQPQPPVAAAPEPVVVDRFAALGEIRAEESASIALGGPHSRSANVPFGELLSAVLGEQP